MRAADKGHVEVIETLLQWGADPNVKSKRNRDQAWQIAYKSRHQKASKILFDASKVGTRAPPQGDRIGWSDSYEAPDNEDSFGNRVLCSDGSCIGVVGPDGRCKVCGKPYKRGDY
jgi:hypothetical protein